MNWYKMFQPHILDRGIEYYEGGAVTEFEISSDGHEINAIVEGAEDYRTASGLRGGGCHNAYQSGSAVSGYEGAGEGHGGA